MATKQPALNSTTKYHWGLKLLDSIRAVLHSQRLSIVLNGNNPPTIKSGTCFYVYSASTHTITTSEATIDVSYPHNTAIPIVQAYYIFESADVVFAWNTGNVPAKSNSTTYYISCGTSDDTLYAKRGQGVYYVDTLAPTEDLEKGGYYNSSSRKVLASFYVDGSGVVGSLYIYHWTKIANNSITTAMLQDSAVTNSKIADGSITAAKCSGSLYPSSFPIGTIVMHTGDGIDTPLTRTESIGSRGGDTISLAGWYVCNGQASTPNLADRFVIGNSATKAAKSTGGSNSTTLTTTQLPSHSHVLGSNAKAAGSTGGGGGGTNTSYINAAVTSGAGSNGQVLTGSTDSAGSGSAYDSTPAYYSAVYLIRIS